jgi:hypothetical protein
MDVVPDVPLHLQFLAAIVLSNEAVDGAKGPAFLKLFLMEYIRCDVRLKN